MKISERITAIKQAYTRENLNLITRGIITAYREKRYSLIVNIINAIPVLRSEVGPRIRVAFSKLIFLYHPDRLNHYLREIELAERQNDQSALDPFMHIFNTLDVLKNTTRKIPGRDPENVQPDLEFGYDNEDFDRIIDPYNAEASTGVNQHPTDFISILAITEFNGEGGGIDSFHLRELEGLLDLSGRNLTDLSGIEQCINLSAINLSDNELVDITQLGYLAGLKELYLANNSITDVDGLSALAELRILDLSFNSVSETGYLNTLNKLEFLNLIDNPVSAEVINSLKRDGLMIVI